MVGALRGPIFQSANDMLCSDDGYMWMQMYVYTYRVNYQKVHTQRHALSHYMRGKLSTWSRRSMNCTVTALHEGSIGVYKKWLGHSMTAIIK